MDKLIILYGTQTGNAERLALRISRLALRQGIKAVHCLPADDVPISEWPKLGGPLLFLVSNANQGDAPNTFRRSWSALLQPETAPPSCMSGLNYAVYGLGDSLYMKFNYMAKMLHNRLRQLGGSPVVLRGLGDESDAKGLEETLAPWLVELWGALGVRQLPTAAVGTSPPRYPQQDVPYFPLYSVESAAGSSSAEATAQVGYAEPVFECEVVANCRITAEACAQAVHHLRLRTCAPAANKATASAPSYDIGDALGVYSPNRPELVAELLERLQRSGEDVVIVRPDGTHGLSQQPPRPFFGQPLTLRTLLTRYFDLDAVVTQDFMWMLAHEVKGSDAEETAHDFRERLYELGNPSNVNDYLQYAHREKRNICEVLHDFKDLHPSLELVLSFAAPMLPRYFSIASAPSLDGPGHLDLCVGALDWHTPLKRHRTGLCSTYLCSAPVGSRLTCFVWQGSLALPATPSPLLCIATGTGIAPIRALLRQVAGLSDQGWRDVSLLLVFGCRHEAEDYLYREEWEVLRSANALPNLTVIPAFSRDTAKKIYVQHQLGLHAKLVSTFVQPEEVSGALPGAVYVCGNAKQMPKDVQRAVEQIVEATIAGVEDAVTAAAYVRGLARVGRYQVDSWSS